VASILRLATGDEAKALPRKLRFTIAALCGIKAPSNGRTTVYDAKTPGLAFVVTDKDARSFYVIRRIHGRATRLRLGGAEMTIDQARAAAAIMQGDIAGGVNPSAERRQKRRAGTLLQLWDTYRDEHLKPRCSPRTLATDESRWNTCLSDWASRNVESIGEPEIRSLHAKIGLERGHTSANRAVQLLRRMFNFARLTPNPVAPGCVSMFRETSRTRFLSPAEMQRFLAALNDKEINPDIADIIRLSLFSGARRMNCQGARTDEFDIDAGTWTIPAGKSKNSETMVLPLVPQALKIVKARLKHENGYLFPSHSALGHIVEIKSTWKKLLKKAELTDLHFHDCRRSFGSWMAAQGTSLSIIGKSLGHRHLAATEIYSRLDLSAVRCHAEAAVSAMLTAKKGHLAN
jgi:integrase